MPESREILPTGQESRGNACQVRDQVTLEIRPPGHGQGVTRGSLPCLTRPSLEIALAMPTLDGPQVTTYRACQRHAEELARNADNRIVAIRAYVSGEQAYVQTFLPYASFERSAAVLDRRRLGNQRRENLWLMNALLLDGGWRHHALVSMWRGYELHLFDYHTAICEEWSRRGYVDNCLDKAYDIYEKRHDITAGQALPPWLGDDRLHWAYRGLLYKKHPEAYPQFWPYEHDQFPTQEEA